MLINVTYSYWKLYLKKENFCFAKLFNVFAEDSLIFTSASALNLLQ